MWPGIEAQEGDGALMEGTLAGDGSMERLIAWPGRHAHNRALDQPSHPGDLPRWPPCDPRSAAP